LADASRSAATPQLRNMGTIGGNLLQQTRCWYYRGPFDCWLKGGETCYARKGDNELHSIFMSDPSVSPCVSANPSDPAAALLALAGVALFVEMDSERIVQARVALSGVAPIPMRVPSVEQLLLDKGTSADVDELSDLLVAEARPLEHNAYKVALLRGLFKKALR